MNRLAILQAASAELEEAVSVADVCAVIVHHGRSALGARHALLALLDEPRGELVIHRATGMAPGALEGWKRFALSAPIALADSARRNHAVFLETLEDALEMYPQMMPLLALMRARACATVPLCAGSRMLGALGLCFAVPRRFGEEERSLLHLFSRQAGAAMERAQRYEMERAARADAELEKGRSEFLAVASGALTSSLEYQTTLEKVVRLAVPYLADGCTIDMLDGSADGTPNRNKVLTRLAAAHIDPARERLLGDALRDQPIRMDGPHPIARVARSGTPILVGAMDPSQLSDFSQGLPGLDWPNLFPVVSYMVVPLLARDRILGTVMFVSERSSRRYRDSDLALAESLAQRAVLAVENAKLYEDAQRAIRARDDVLAIVSHDLRNPLGVVRAMMGMLRRRLPEDPQGARALEHCRSISRAVDRMDRLIDDLLDVTSIDAGRLAIEPCPIDAAALADEAVTSLRPLAAESGLSIVADLPQDVCLILGDRARLLQVFSNLIGNAMKFTPSGGVIMVTVTPSGDEVHFCVEDTGPGIAPDHLPHIFDRYWQHGGATLRRGCGLGLAIVRGIVEAHGGRVSVSSEPGRGARFVFTLRQAP